MKNHGAPGIDGVSFEVIEASGVEGFVMQILQLHGGYGFIQEYPIFGDYQDAAVQTIYAGSNEIMKVIIARRLVGQTGLGKLVLTS